VSDSPKRNDRRRWLTLAGGTIGLLFFLLALYSALEFLRASEPVALLRWGAAMFFSMGVVIAIKIWYWIEAQRDALERRLERLELRVSDLAGRLEAP